MPALPRTIAMASASSVLLLSLVSCGTTVPATGVDAAAEPASEAAETSAWPTCEELIPEVVNISASQGEPSIAQVYTPTVVADHTADYDSGALTVPEGSTRVVVLECSGTSAWTDQDEVPLDFRLEMDLNKEMFVSFEPAPAE